MKLRYILPATFAITIAATGCKEQGSAEQIREVPVIEIVKTDSAIVADRYSAVIEGRQDVELYPQISGKLTKICVGEGDEVNAGQLLFVIDQAPYQAAVRMAVANVHAAESRVATARLERDSKQALFDGQVISEYELQTARNDLSAAEAALEQARAALADARNNLSYTEIKSPARGVVGIIPYRVGTLVSPQMAQPLTTVSDNAEMWVYFSMSEKEMQMLMRRHGSHGRALASFPPVSLSLSDGSDYELSGRVETVSGMVNPHTGAVRVKSVFGNPDHRLLSGSTGNVVIPHTERDVVIIPKGATYEIQDKVYVYRVKDNIVEAVEVSVSPIDDGDNYIVLSGLESGDRIVSEGVGSLRDGQTIKTREARK